MRSTITFFLAVLVVGCGGDPSVGHIRRTTIGMGTKMELHGPYVYTLNVDLDLPRGFTLPELTMPTLEDQSGRRYHATEVSLSSASSSGEQRIAANFVVAQDAQATKLYVGDLVVDFRRSEVRHVSK